MDTNISIHLHDGSGHPFQVQLSRELATRGHRVLHTYMAEMQSPKGRLQRERTDPDGLRIEGLRLGKPFAKYSYWRRWLQERQFGQMLARRVANDRPDVFLACNMSLDILAPVHNTCRKLGIRVVFWVQDLYGHAIKQILGNRYLGAGELIARYYIRKEYRLLAASDHAVAITEDFRPFLNAAGVPDERLTVIPNWAPLEEVPLRDKANPWSVANNLDQSFVFLYSGTLGLKHNPQLLVGLANGFRDDPETRIVVISEGLGADWLSEKKQEQGLDNLILLPFQPFESIPEVLGSANVLIALLEKSAGVFSVPSKVLTSLCAGRPVLLAAPGENLASRLIKDEGAGCWSDPDDEAEFVGSARKLASDPEMCRDSGNRARAYADDTFDIAAITDRFERLLVQD